VYLSIPVPGFVAILAGNFLAIKGLLKNIFIVDIKYVTNDLYAISVRFLNQYLLILCT
jgi:hypothetical protein